MQRHTIVVHSLLVSTLLSAGLVGCASDGSPHGPMSGSPILGTWQGRETEGGNAAATQPAGFQFASVSFVYDGTFTAQMRYHGQLMADSGTYTYHGDQLTVQGSHPGERHYTARVHGNELTVTDPQTQVSVVLDRMKK